MSEPHDIQDFVHQAEKTQTGFLVELWMWLHHNKKWWLAPILVGLLLISVLLVLSGTAVAPFIYALF